MKHLFIIFLIVLLASCSHETDLNEFRNQHDANMLTLNSILTPDSTICVVATSPYFFTDIHNGYQYVDNLKIDLFVNNDFKESLTFDSDDHTYHSNIRPNVGDEIALRTIYKDQPVSASDIIPVAPTIVDVQVKRDGPIPVYYDNDYVISYFITIQDNPDEENYYFLRYYQPNSTTETWMGTRDYSHEYVFQQLAKTINAHIPGWTPYSESGLPFSDAGINGKAHTIVVKETIQCSFFTAADQWTTLPRTFQLFAISKPYYNYLVSLLCDDKSDDNIHSGMLDLGLADPMKIYSNIEGGLGILCSYTSSQHTVDVIKLCGKFPK